MTWLSWAAVFVSVTTMGMLTECGEPSGHDALATRLEAANYRQLVSEGSPIGDSLWDNGDNAQALAAIVLDNSRAQRLRFLALELSWTRLSKLPDGIDTKVAASVIVPALQHTPFESENWGLAGNDWGFLWYMEADGYEGARPLGQHLIALGADAVAPLAALLNNNAPVEYEGGKEAMVGNELGLRVKDVAAYFIGRITGKPMQYSADVAERDRRIAAIQAQLH